jgi:cell division septation protein DedD
MDSTLKQRLIGAAVLAALAIIFLPMLLKGPDVKQPDAAEVPLSMPATPGQEYETRELPLTVPEGSAPAGGVLGMAPGSAAKAPMPAPEPSPATADSAASTTATTTAPTPAASAPSASTPGAANSTPAPAPAKPVADATQTSALVGAGNYVVNIGSFGNLANANALAAKLRAANLPVTADRVTLATGSAMRLRVGPYADRAAAEAARLRAESVTGGSTKVIALDASPAAANPAKPASTTPAAATPSASAAKPATTASTASKPTTAAPPAAKSTTAATASTPAAKPTTVASTSTPAATKPVALNSGFAVQLSAPSVEADANALRDRARNAGFSSFVQRVDTEAGVRFRVRVGPVADRSAAETLRDAVNGKLGSKGIVVANP